MTTKNAPEIRRRCLRTVWRSQTTFATPLDNLDSFVNTICSASDTLECGVMVVDTWVFTPKYLQALLSSYSLNTDLSVGRVIEADGPVETRSLLRAGLSDWVDFWVLPKPGPFVIYADHDEYTTFFANTKSNLNRVAQPLLAGGFKQISDYQREF